MMYACTQTCVLGRISCLYALQCAIVFTIVFTLHMCPRLVFLVALLRGPVGGMCWSHPPPARVSPSLLVPSHWAPVGVTCWWWWCGVPACISLPCGLFDPEVDEVCLV